MANKKYYTWYEFERKLEKKLANELGNVLDDLFTKTTGIPVPPREKTTAAGSRVGEYIHFEEVKS